MPRWDLQVRANRQRAIANGDETYQGSPCKHGHPGIRMLRYHGKCWHCHKGKNPYYTHNRDEVLRRARQKREEDPARYLWRAAKQRARQTGREFNIELQDITIPTHCPISGMEMTAGSPDAPSLDRIDNSRGYVKGNVAVISKRMNAIKGTATIGEVQALLDYMREQLLS